ncbi:MAG: hypothetical protein E6I40_07150 [Chloroflexi bacterium]|nr:MAG: hypothetical protein E6I40_07150 [Chloroflexota bacterium]
MAVRMSRVRAWLDASPLAALGLALMREATGQVEPLAPLVPTRPAALRRGKRIAVPLEGASGSWRASGLHPDAAALLRRCVVARASLVVSGATGSGKSTLLRSLADAIPHDERLIVIEDTNELVLPHPHAVHLECVPAREGGASTVAALLAHRSAAGGEAPLLVDLDRWAPSLALRAGLSAATIVDALVQPGRERELVSRWSAVPFLPGSPSFHASFDAARVCALLETVAEGRALVADLGAGADALEHELLATLDRLCVVSGTHTAQLQALFCAVPLLERAPCAVGLVVTAADPEDAARIAGRVGFPLLAAIPSDPYLATDDFAARAPTLRAVDELLRSLH